MTDPVLLSPLEVAHLLGVNRRTVYRWIKDGTLPKVPLGGRLVKVPRYAIDDLVEAAS